MSAPTLLWDVWPARCLAEKWMEILLGHPQQANELVVDRRPDDILDLFADFAGDRSDTSLHLADHRLRYALGRIASSASGGGFALAGGRQGLRELILRE